MKLIRIRFLDQASNRQSLAFLAGRFSFTGYETGEMVVGADAVKALAVQGFSFVVEGTATYVDSIPALRTAAANPGI